jgi:hypothetical protein
MDLGFQASQARQIVAGPQGLLASGREVVAYNIRKTTSQG